MHELSSMLMRSLYHHVSYVPTQVESIVWRIICDKDEIYIMMMTHQSLVLEGG